MRPLYWCVGACSLAVATAANAGVDPSGQFRQDISIAVPDYHSITPKLALRYASDRGDGLAGMGWSLDSGPQIARMSKTLGVPRWDATDVFVLDGQALVPCAYGSTSPSCTSAGASSAGYFSTQIESFKRIHQDSATGWTLWERDGTQEILASYDSGRTFVLAQILDLHGNHVDFSYTCTTTCSLDHVVYAGNPHTGIWGADIHFFREARPDPVAGPTGALSERLRSVSVAMDGKLVRAYKLTYAQSNSNGASILTSVQQFGNDVAIDASGTITAGTSYPPITLTTPSLATGSSLAFPTMATPTLASVTGTTTYASRFGQTTFANPGELWFDSGQDDHPRPYGSTVGDFDGDGRTDWVSWGINAKCNALKTVTIFDQKTGASSQVANQITLTSTTNNTATCNAKVWVLDLDGDHRDDMLVQLGSTTYALIANRSGGFYLMPSTLATTGTCITGDFDGDGREDLVCGNGSTATTYLTQAGTTFSQVSDALPAALVAAPLVTTGDFNADGLQDVVFANAVNGTYSLTYGIAKGDGHFNWSIQTTPWPSNASDKLLSGDLDGDGKGDIVLVHPVAAAADVVELGFSAKGAVYPNRFRLAQVASASWLENVDVGDFDGDGKLDLLLGNTQSWAHGHGDGTFDAPPATTVMTGCAYPSVFSIVPADFNGDGRTDIACLVDALSGGPLTLSDRMSSASSTDVSRWMSGDVTGDGLPDLVYVHHTNPGYQFEVIANGSTTVTTTTIVGTALPGLDEADTSRFMLVDVGGPNGVADGKADLVLISTYGGSLIVHTFLATGNGQFTATYDQPWKNGSGQVVGYGAIDLQNWRPANLNNDGMTDFVHVYSLGTGVLVEYLLSRGNGTYQNGGDYQFLAGSAWPLSTPAVQDFVVADVDGDGISDLVEADLDGTTGTIRTLINKGDATFVEHGQSVGYPSFRDMRRMRVADINGDGRADLVHVGSNTSMSYFNILTFDAYTSDGAGNWVHSQSSLSKSTSTLQDEDLLEEAAFVRFMDIDGNGKDDIVLVTNYFDGTSTKANLITAISPWAGANLIPTVTPLALAGSYDFQPWRWQAALDATTGNASLAETLPYSSLAIQFARASDRLSRIDNGNSGAVAIEYAPVLGGYRDYLPVGFVPRVVSALTTTDQSYSPAISERVTYNRSLARYSNVLRRYGFGFEAITDHGKVTMTSSAIDDQCGTRPTQVTVADLTWTALAYDQVAYLNEGSGPYTCQAYDIVHYGCDHGTCKKLIETTTTYDAYGNRIGVTEVANAALSKMVSTVPATPNLGAYIVDRPASKATYELDRGWTLKAYEMSAYDNLAVGGIGALGDLTSLAKWDGTAILTTSYTYNANGVLSNVVAPNGLATATTYDTRYGIYPSLVCVNTTHCTQHTIDVSSGLETATRDEDLATTSFTFDPLGRQTRVTNPDASYTITTYTTNAGHRVVGQQRSDGSADGVLARERWIDGLGRTFHTQREDGAAQDMTYANATSHPATVSTIYMEGTSPAGVTTYSYDPLDRVLVQKAPDNSTRTTAYSTSAVTHRDELGVPHVSNLDGRNEVIRLDEVNAGVTTSTTYLHDIFGHVTRITDALGNVTTYVFDGLGREVSSTNPDRGTTLTAYQTNGQIDHVTDVANQTTRYQYDVLGRMIERDDVAANGTITRTATLYWDIDANGFASGKSRGRLVQVSDVQANATLGEHYTYDNMGRATSSQSCINATCMTMQQTFDPAGRIATLTYPDSEVVTYSYDNGGRQVKLSGYATATYGVDDRLATLSYTNGEVITEQRDSLRGWLSSAVATVPVRLGLRTFQATVYSATYTHDLAARIHNLTLVNGASVPLAYTYDDLGRLTTVSSDAAHSESFTYDALGRMQYSTHNGDYHYADLRHVHAPTSSDNGDLRTYDTVGNLLALRDASGRSLDFGWTADEHMGWVRNNNTATLTNYVYDRTGERVAKLGAQSDLFFGPYVEQKGGTLIKYYMLGGRLVARNDGAVSYYTADHRGSTRMVTSATAAVSNRYDYAAFGRSLGKTENIAQDFELGGGRLDDESGLTFMHARFYDDEMEHFISADTLVPNMLDPQSLHRYSYTEQDPINFTDPSGHLRMQIEWKLSLDAQAKAEDLRAGACSGAGMGCSGGFDADLGGFHVDSLMSDQAMWNDMLKKTIGTLTPQFGNQPVEMQDAPVPQSDESRTAFADVDTSKDRMSEPLASAGDGIPAGTQMTPVPATDTEWHPPMLPLEEIAALDAKDALEAAGWKATLDKFVSDFSLTTFPSRGDTIGPAAPSTPDKQLDDEMKFQFTMDQFAKADFKGTTVEEMNLESYASSTNRYSDWKAFMNMARVYQNGETELKYVQQTEWKMEDSLQQEPRAGD